MKNIRYITIEQVQKEKIFYYRSYHKNLSFAEAVQNLLQKDQIHCGIPKIPDFLSWNRKNNQSFLKIAEQIPVPLDEILDQPEFRNLSPKRNIQVGIDTCYASDELFIHDRFTVNYVLSGSGLLCTASFNHRMEAGELCILPPGVPHAILNGPEDVIIAIMSERPAFQEHFKQLLYQDNLISDFLRKSLFEDAHECLFFRMPATPDFLYLIQHLFHEFFRNDPYSEAAFYSYLHLLYADIIRSGKTSSDYFAERSDITAGSMMPAILEYISANFRDLTLGDLADHFHFSVPYLSRAIHSSTEKNFQRIITELKIKEACSLLTDSDLKMEEVASACGYHSMEHFSHAFKKELGMAPSSYRRSQTASGKY